MEPNRNDDIKGQLKKIICSDVFRDHSLKYGRLLEYLVMEALKGQHVKEMTIAAGFYGKPIDPPPGSDHKRSFVRVDAGTLRDLLHEYYLKHAWTDECLIDIPKGGYLPVISFRSSRETSTGKGAARATSKDLTIKITAKYEHFNNVLGILPALRELSGDPELQIIALSISSIILTITCSAAGYRKLKKALADGALERTIGHPIESVGERLVYAFEGKLADFVKQPKAKRSPASRATPREEPSLPGTPENRESERQRRLKE